MMTTSPSNASLLPGIDDAVKPEYRQNYLSMEDCFNQTNTLLSNPAIVAEYNTINSQFIAQSDSSGCVTLDNGDYECTDDFSKYPSQLQSVCDDNGGRYDERSHQIECGAGAQKFIYKVVNYPTCFDADCDSADLERFMARDVEDLKFAIEDQLQMDCNSTYEVEDPGENGLGDNLPGPAGDNATVVVTCPVRKQDTPSKCGPLGRSTNGKICDCYTFCDGVLIGCEYFDGASATEFLLSCNNGHGDFVAGCTNELFAIYEAWPSASPTSFRTMTLALVACLITLFLSRM